MCSTPDTKAIYENWGGSTCSGDEEMIYQGYMANALYTHTGSGYNYLCLHSEPQYLKTTSVSENLARVILLLLLQQFCAGKFCFCVFSFFLFRNNFVRVF